MKACSSLWKYRLAIGSCVAVLAITATSRAARGVSPRPTNAIEKVAQAASEGRIDHYTTALYNLYAIKSPQLLPAEFRSDEGATPVRCATPVLSDALQALESAPEVIQIAAAALAGRPSLTHAFASPGGHFVIHYNLSGIDAVPAFDFDSTGVPDYIELVAWAADSSWHYEVEVLGWRPPPSDGTNGGDSRYDIYCKTISNYGYTEIEAQGAEPWNDRTSFIVIRKNYYNLPPNEDPQGSEVGSVKVTISHEFNHACQLAYRSFDELFWFELCATYMEEVVFSEVNDNFQFLEDYFDLPWKSLYDDGYHMYGAFPFALRLAAMEHDTLIRDCWEGARYLTITNAIDSVLGSRGSSFAGEFYGFSIWNNFTGSRDDGLHYVEGSEYPEVVFSPTPTYYPFSNYASPTMEAMSANYRILMPHPSGRSLMLLTFNGAPSRDWRIRFLQRFDGGSVRELELQPNFATGDSSIYINGFDSTVSMTMITANVTPIAAGGSGQYQLSADFIISGDVNDDNNINILDITYLIDYVFRFGPEPVPELAYGDANCDTVVNVVDVIRLIDFVFRSGAEPCPPLLF